MESNQKISPFSLTHIEFSNQIQAALGKGRQHAILVYEELFRTGQIEGKLPAFNNAQVLLQQITNLCDFTLPTLLKQNDDGKTGKFLLQTDDRLEIESVMIPMQAGGTLCISSQIGCRMGCAFCETGRMGLLRNLTAAEIISQAFVARHQLNFPFRNVVFMGMGEPFDNYDAVMQAVRLLQDPKAFTIGRKQITISTSGCVDGILRLISEEDHGPNLAVSVTAPTDELRNRLMPVNRKHNLAELYSAMKEYCDQTEREILIAYVLLQGVNDSPEHANALADYLTGLNVKINLIPYNPQSRDRFAPPELSAIEAFAAQLRARDYVTLVRITKGQSIMAACGQLGNLKLRRNMVTR